MRVTSQVEAVDTRPAGQRGWLSRVWGADSAVPLLSWRPLAMVLGLLTVWRLAILVASYAAGGATNFARCGIPGPMGYSVCWDSWHYLGIAGNGYTFTPDSGSSIAFFPLFPLLIHVVDRLLPGANLGDVRAALVVVHLALAAALVYIYHLLRLDFSDRVAWRALFFLLIFPSAFFFSTVYTESLLLLGLAGTLYHARRGQWLRAGLFGLLTSATKLTGVMLVVPLAMEVLAQRAVSWRRPRPLLAVAITPLGLLAYFGYLQARFGDFRVYFEAQALGWHRETFSPGVFLLGIQRLFDDTRGLIYYSDTSVPSLFLLTDTALLLAFIAAGVVLWLRVRPSYGALVLSFLALPALSGSPQSINRFVVILFPAFILLGKIESEPARNALTIPALLGQGLLIYFFVNGMWAG